MTKTMKTSLAVFKQELQQQFISMGLVLFFFILSMLMTRFILSSPRGLDQTFIIFYTLIIGFILPWQLNTNGHLAPGYCRYHLSLPVATWQLSVIPFLSRLLLILSFIGIEMLLQLVLFGTESRHFTQLFIWRRLSQVTLMIYLLFQAFAWSKDCFKNLFSWVFIAIGLQIILKPELLPKVLDNDNLIIYLLIIATLSTLSLVGVRNQRRGTIVFRLPGWTNLAALMEKLSFKRNKHHKDAGAAHFYQLWKQSWYYMPLITLAIIGVMFLIKGRPLTLSDLTNYGYIKISAAYKVMIIATSLAGIIIINKNAFNTSYTANLPVNSRTITIAKIKCFCLSFAICLGIYLLWIGYRFDTLLLHVIRMRSEVLLHSPGVIIWMLAAFIIWSYTLAFVIVAGYMKYRIFTFAILALIFEAFFYSRGCLMTRFLHFKIPTYVLIIAGVNMLLFGKLAFCYCCNTKKLKRYLITVTSCIASAILAFFCCKYTVLFFIPLAALFAYPIIAQDHDDKRRNHEIISRPAFPKRLAAGVVIIFLCFSGFTAWLNSIQKTELDSLVKQYQTRVPSSTRLKQQPSQTYEEYIKQNLPYKKELLPKLMAVSGRNIVYPYKVRMFLISTVSNMLKQQEYKKAFKVLIFGIQVSKFGKMSYPFCSEIKRVLKCYKPSSDELEELTSLLRKSLEFRLKKDKKNLIGPIILRDMSSPAFTFISSTWVYDVYSNYPKHYLRFVLPSFNECFFSPLCYNDSINYMNNAFDALKAMNYMLTGNEKYFTTRRISLNLISCISNDWWTCNSILRSTVYVATIKYQRKYGKKPESIKQLVPEFLHKNETWLFNTDYYKPVLQPNSLKKLTAYN